MSKESEKSLVPVDSVKYISGDIFAGVTNPLKNLLAI